MSDFFSISDGKLKTTTANSGQTAPNVGDDGSSSMAATASVMTLVLCLIANRLTLELT